MPADRMTRREMLSRVGAGLTVAAAGLSERRLIAQSPGWRTVRSGGTVKFPAGAIVRTVLKDLPPAALAGGATMFHEHLVGVGNYSTPPPADQCPMPCSPPVSAPELSGVDLLVEELKATASDGVACIVNSTIARPTAQQVGELRDLAVRSGMHIVAAGGYFRQNYPADFARLSEAAFADMLVADAQAQRWGALGEIGTSMQMEADERKCLLAVAMAHARTNLPIFTHTPHQSCPACAIEQVEILTSRGVNPRSLCIGHMSTIKLADDRTADSFKAVVRAGAFIGIDTVGHQMAQSHIPERQKVSRVRQLLDAGYENQLLFSSDFAQSHNLKANWGNGYSSVVLQFVPKLRQAGVADATLHKILVDNPRRFLAFTPKPA